MTICDTTIGGLGGAPLGRHRSEGTSVLAVGRGPIDTTLPG